LIGVSENQQYLDVASSSSRALAVGALVSACRLQGALETLAFLAIEGQVVFRVRFGGKYVVTNSILE
jgi:hypothetical protein